MHWSRLSYTFTWVREYFWSLHVFEWLVVAGVIAVARISPVKAVFLGAWFFAFLFSRGGDPALDIRQGTLWPALVPALPALAVLIAAIPLLVPKLGPRLVHGFAAATPRAVRRWAVATAAIAGAAVPFVLVAAASPAASAPAVSVPADLAYVPAGRPLGLRAAAAGGVVTLSWRPAGGPTTVLYRLYRAAPGARGRLLGLCALPARRRGRRDNLLDPGERPPRARAVGVPAHPWRRQRSSLRRGPHRAGLGARLEVRVR